MTGNGYNSRMIRFTLAMALCLLPVSGQKTWTDAEVMKVHRSALIIDGHNDVTSFTEKGLDIGLLRKEGHSDAVRMKQGGMAGQFFAAYVGVEYMAKGQSAHRAMQMIDTIRFDIVDKHPADFTLALTADDILRARKQGKIAALIGIEGGHAIEDDLRLLRDYEALGARYMTLTHTRNLSWAGSSAEKDNRGLSEFGRQVIA
ncbi:MAG: membrane dipeptidase, partial [Acidobacteria bacterium]|nr:membrane dipeptidase [Acidobacteriota bacterium]